MSYECATCGGPVTLVKGQLPYVVPYVDGDGKRKSKTLYFDGLGTWHCKKGCRKPKMSTNKGKYMKSRNETLWGFSPVLLGHRTPVRSSK